MEISLGLPQKVRKEPAIPLLGMYPKATKSGSWKDSCAPKFIAVTKTWKQPNCPSVDEWRKKTCCLCRLSVCLSIRHSTILSKHTHTYILRDEMHVCIEVQLIYSVTFISGRHAQCLRFLWIVRLRL